MTKHTLFILFFILCGLATSLHGKPIHIPGDATNIQEAVELAESGDEILIASDSINWTSAENLPDYNQELPGTKPGLPGFKIKNKNLVFRGGLPNRQVQIIEKHGFFPDDEYSDPNTLEDSTLWIEDSRVVFENLYIRGKYYNFFLGFPGKSALAPIRLLSGELIIRDCTYIGSIEASGPIRLENVAFQANTFEYGRYSNSTYKSALLLQNASQCEFEIINSQLDGVADPKTPYSYDVAYKILGINNLSDCQIQILNSKIRPGDFFAGLYTTLHRNFEKDGSAGIEINSCTNLILNLQQSVVHGGEGNGIDTVEEPLKAANGGDGIQVKDSIVELHNGTLVGGTGEKGGTVHDPITFEHLTDNAESGDGGYALSAYNSRVRYRGTLFEGGWNGAMTEKAASIFHDDLSSIIQISI